MDLIFNEINLKSESSLKSSYYLILLIADFWLNIFYKENERLFFQKNRNRLNSENQKNKEIGGLEVFSGIAVYKKRQNIYEFDKRMNTTNPLPLFQNFRNDFIFFNQTNRNFIEKLIQKKEKKEKKIKKISENTGLYFVRKNFYTKFTKFINLNKKFFLNLKKIFIQYLWEFHREGVIYW